MSRSYSHSQGASAVSLSQSDIDPIRLVCTAGPHPEKVITLNGPETSIGRDAGNHISIDDAAVSRYHCRIRKGDGGFSLQDLESLNGTLINDVPASDQVLKHGDRIRIGASEFLFLVGGEDIVRQKPASNQDDIDLAKYATVVLKQSDSIYLSGDSTVVFPRFPLPSSRMIRDLGALFRISHSISTLRSPEELQQRLLELIFEVIPAERGAILLVGHDPDLFISRIYRQRAPKQTGALSVSRTVTQQVLREGNAVMSNDIGEDRRLSATTSLTVANVQSLLCVPLKVYESTLGVIYLDTSLLGTRFDEGHLQLLSAIAPMAAVALDHTKYVGWLEDENRRLQQEVNIEHSMLGKSPVMHQLHQLIARVAPRESTVLISGESGTGKELVARAIHTNSARANKPFVAINCAAISEHLLESELFGHEKGAFTDAVTQKPGKIEVANGGTLFLDEIGELAPRLQAKLLRVLQERELTRVGGTEAIKVDIRLITATNRNLEKSIKEGSFRQDLYFRLNVISIVTPPLRERREDIPVLVAHFLKKYSERSNRTVIGISREALALLRHYDWPGNVRELENAIERAVVLGQSERIFPEDLPEFLCDAGLPGMVTSTKYHEAVRQLKKHLIIDAVEQAKGTYVEAAKLLGLHPNYLHRLIREMGLKSELKDL